MVALPPALPALDLGAPDFTDQPLSLPDHKHGASSSLLTADAAGASYPFDWSAAKLRELASGLAPQAVADASSKLAAASAGKLGKVDSPAGFRERLAAVKALDGGPAQDAQHMLLSAASLVAVPELNAIVAAAAFSFAAKQLFATAGLLVQDQNQDPGKQELWLRCAVTICTAATTRLTDKKAGEAAATCLHALADRRFTVAVAVLWPIVSAAGHSPAPATAAMQWLAVALSRWSLGPKVHGDHPKSTAPTEANMLDPGLIIRACAFALGSPAAPVRKAGLAAIVALERHCPVLAAVSSLPGISSSMLGTVRAELEKQPPSRVVFDRAKLAPLPSVQTPCSIIPTFSSESPGDASVMDESFSVELSGLTPRSNSSAAEFSKNSATHCLCQRPEAQFVATTKNPSALRDTHALHFCVEPPLQFESAFECGNLARANMVDCREYSLWLSPDTNVKGSNSAGREKIHTQWFFFRVQGLVKGQPYRFTIHNFEKRESLYSQGMQPLVYSQAAAQLSSGRHGWKRAGTNIRYRPAGPRPIAKCEASDVHDIAATMASSPSIAACKAEASESRSKNDCHLASQIDGETELELRPTSELSSNTKLVAGQRVRLIRNRLLRVDASLSSAKAGSLAAGTEVKILEIASIQDATTGKATTRLRCDDGWFSDHPEAVETCGSQGRPRTTAVRAKGNASKRIGKELTNGQCYWALEFTLETEYDDDVLYVAHGFPYSYTHLQQQLTALERSPCVLERKTIATTALGRKVEALTISASPEEERSNVAEDGGIRALPKEARQQVVLMSRVHPGETNASWIMDGVLSCLTDPDSISVGAALRRRFVFTCVPMLNPDGVAVGNYRCSWAGVDLNRQWSDPCPVAHPEIFAAKLLLRELQAQPRSSSAIPEDPQDNEGQGIALFFDLHGHSTQLNSFLYGTQAGPAGRVGIRVFPKLFADIYDGFSYDQSRFSMGKNKQSTGRVVASCELGIKRAYTLESSLGGASLGRLVGKQYSSADYMDLGHSLCAVTLAAFGPNRTRWLNTQTELEEEEALRLARDANNTVTKSNFRTLSAVLRDASDFVNRIPSPSPASCKSELTFLDEDESQSTWEHFCTNASTPLSCAIQKSPPSSASLSPAHDANQEKQSLASATACGHRSVSNLLRDADAWLASSSEVVSAESPLQGAQPMQTVVVNSDTIHFVEPRGSDEIDEDCERIEETGSKCSARYDQVERTVLLPIPKANHEYIISTQEAEQKREMGEGETRMLTHEPNTHEKTTKMEEKRQHMCCDKIAVVGVVVAVAVGAACTWFRAPKVAVKQG